MRETKFRAWDIENKRWIDPMEVFGDWNKTPWFAVVTAIGETIQLNNDNGLIWVQYTGLKDKNGVEIYEGHIVKYKPYHNGYYEDEFLNGEVKWGETGDSDGYSYGHHYEWVVNEDSLADIADGKYENYFCEVIGNIYENPELLPDKQEVGNNQWPF